MTEIEQVIFDLEQLKNGANVHTVNKAIHYLKEFSKKDSWLFPDKEERESKLKTHLQNCRVSVNTKIFSDLSETMKWWF